MSALQDHLEDCAVSIASRGDRLPPDGRYLPPRLWEKLRARLQSYFRRATGEPDAVLVLLQPGQRILGPNEVDPVTVERCAQIAEDHSAATSEMAEAEYYSSASSAVLNCGRGIATAIRAIASGGKP